MNSLNVFHKDTYRPWKYPANWWDNVKQFIRNVKYAWQRVTCGYCDRDVWGLCDYYLDIFHFTLRDLALHHYGYPGTEPFDTDDKWKDYLMDISWKFYQANECHNAFPRPMYEKWAEDIMKHPEDLLNYQSPYSKEMMEEDAENWYKRKAAFDEAWKMLGEHFWSLWD